MCRRRTGEQLGGRGRHPVDGRIVLARRLQRTPNDSFDEFHVMSTSLVRFLFNRNDMTSPYPTTNSPAGLSPGLGPTTPGTPVSTHGVRATTSTRSHLNPLSTRLAPTSRAGSVLGGSVAATSVHLHQANPEDFEKALDEFVERQLPELEKLLVEVVGGM